ncbi:DUF4430 domain-containing protein [Pseudalkalibacillus caeni]|uniref:DUF4430 domain-containing protein n=1 Tax=Exobacillus caeni TaxID=2574798 RepID=A0A5R9EXT1_9BACL|nr:DUF4430 domain-containing protein [Pseudalkalibacillus caeni]TLS35917.1 DUF4430 domain-containing protein [Pseudalkalibacillus caeni]
MSTITNKLIVSIILIFSLAACGMNNSSIEGDNITSGSAEEKPAAEKSNVTEPEQKHETKEDQGNSPSDSNNKEETTDRPEKSDETEEPAAPSSGGNTTSKSSGTDVPSSEQEKKDETTVTEAQGETSTSESNNALPEKKESIKKEVPKETVSMTIKDPNNKGTIASFSGIEIKQGDTVLSVLQSTTKSKGIQMSVRGSGAAAYVEGIANIYEFDRGPLSGWVCKKNGAELSKSAGVIPLQSGDKIEWVYTENLGKDL